MVERHKLGRWLWVPIAGPFKKGYLLKLGKLTVGQVLIKESRVTEGMDTFWPEFFLEPAKTPVYTVRLESAQQAVEEALDKWCTLAEEEYVPE